MHGSFSLAADRPANQLLGALVAQGGLGALRAFERRDFPVGTGLALAVGEQPMAWFPETLTACISVSSMGRRTAIGLVGAEAMVGGEALMGRAACLDATVILRGGTAFAVPVPVLRQLCVTNPMFHAAILGACMGFGLEMARLLASALHETGEQRLVRWLLMLDERAAAGALAVTHQELADWAGLRRASVTDCLHLLEGDHLVRCERGRIALRDRIGLRQRLSG